MLIYVIGDVMLDSYELFRAVKLSPEAPVPVVQSFDTFDRLGGAANVAANVSLNNFECVLIGRVGRDAAGDSLKKICIEANIEFREISSPSDVTITKRRLVVDGQHLLRIDNEKFKEPSDDLNRLIKDVEPNSIVILSDYNKGLLENIGELIQTCKNKNCFIIVDPKRPDFSIYRGASLITPNLKEFEVLSNKLKGSLADKCNKVRELYNIENILVTLSENGMFLSTPEGNLNFPSVAQEVVDITGAGDVVVSHIAMWYAKGFLLRDACLRANFAAGYAVGQLGTVAVKLADAERVLSVSNKLNSLGDVDDLSKIVLEKNSGKRIVFTNGCFDILHAGHIDYLIASKSYGDILVVGLNSDASVMNLKGPKRPIISEKFRREMLLALEVVDYVIIFSGDTPLGLIQDIAPNTLTKGADWKNKKVAGADFVLNQGGSVEFIDFKTNISTSNIVNKILEN